MGFRDDFAWGVATASYQIEGAWNEDGRGMSVWDEYTHYGHSFRKQTGDTACDFYHRYALDLAHIRQLGIRAFRFSVAWPRVMPDGVHENANPQGLGYYDRVVDEILENGATPYLTLFHWDYPAALERKGGWTNPNSPMWYRDYVDAVTRRLGDRVKHWITFNEPACFIGLGYEKGIHAPGQKRSTRELALMAHHVLLAHGLGVQAIRGNVADAKVGIAPNCAAHFPKTETNEDIEACKRAYFTLTAENWLFNPAFWSDPILLGHYPDNLVDILGDSAQEMKPDDFAIMRQPLDFYGQNIYTGSCVQSDKDGGFRMVEPRDGYARTAIGWPVTPDSLYWAARFFSERYRLPFLVTENGISCHDWPSLDGRVHDPNRIDYLHRYLLSLSRAANEGIDVLGYFVWTLLDDFEWDTGFNDRFGLIYVDFETQERILKDSAYWYADVIRSNGEFL